MRETDAFLHGQGQGHVHDEGIFMVETSTLKACRFIIRVGSDINGVSMHV
jgi:hypothetical protein